MVSPPPQPPPEQVQHLPVADIVPNPHQPRRRFRPEQLATLACSLRTQGVLQPVLVRPHPAQAGRYELVAGERRWRAARELGWETLPALVRPVADEHLLEAALVENLQREELTPIEEAQAYRALLHRFGYTQEALAGRVGRDRSTIANMMRLLALPLAVQDDLEGGRLSVGHARSLLALDDPAEQLAVREAVVARGLSVRETERLVKEVRRRRTAAPAPQPAPAPDVHFEAAAQALERHFGTRVGIDRQGTQGTIALAFYSVDDFNRIYDKIMGH